jgi:predicted amidohydrolase
MTSQQVPSPSLRAAVVQITVPEEPAAARDSADAAIREAASLGARLVVLPEASMSPFGTDLLRAAEHDARAFEDLLASLAAELGLVIIAGSFEPSGDGRVHNTVLIRGGGADAVYRKIHLFDAFGAQESRTVAPGSDVLLLEVDDFTIGLATCYDIRFPEQFTALAAAGAQAIALPMAWGAGPGKAQQLRVLQSARALDTTCYVLAADQCPPPEQDGRRNSGPRGVGGSAIIGPLGQVVTEVGEREGIAVADLEPQVVTDARSALPLYVDRPTLPVPTRVGRTTLER